MLGLAKSLSSLREHKPNGTRPVSELVSSTSSKRASESPKLKSQGSSSSTSISEATASDSHATIKGRPFSMALGTGPSEEHLHLLAVSAQITEVSYSISDIQTRIFEIQELRHQSMSSSASPSQSLSPQPEPSSTAVIDTALMALDERVELVSNMIRVIDDALEPLLRSTPTQMSYNDTDEEERPEAMALRKHHDMVEAWDEVQNEAEVLKEELREDKWLAVFRTVSSQADDMMSSLEKAVTQCHDFIWQVHRPDAAEPSSSLLPSPGRGSVNLDAFNGILQAYESKKKFYVPATTRVISVIEKGMRERATKNGECLRRHGDMQARWRNLRERMGRIDLEMESVRSILLEREGRDSSDEGSMVSRQTAKSKISTSMWSSTSSKTPRHSAGSAISRSISPFRRFAAKMGVGGTSPPSSQPSAKTPGSEGTPALRKRTSYFSLRPHQSGTPEPRRPGGLPTPPRETSRGAIDTPSKQRWNSSTKVEHKETVGPPTIKSTPPKRRPSENERTVETGLTPPSATRRGPTPSGRPPSRIISSPRALSPTVPPLPPPSGPTTPKRIPRAATPPSHGKKRSVSSNRPITPPPPVPPLPTSNILMRSTTPSMQTPRPRPSSPSHIPVPSSSRSGTPVHFFGGDLGNDPDNPPTSLMQRALSPTFSTISSSTHGGRRSSRLPIPTLQVTSQPPSPSSSAAIGTTSRGSTASSAIRPQTPEATLRARAHQMPFYQSPTPSRLGTTPPGVKSPPSSFRDSVITPGGRTTPSRSSSRTTSHGGRSTIYTPDHNPVPQYVPSGPKDPLDAEVARTVNKLAHGFLIERVDPIPKSPPPNGEYRAQYAISNAFGRKVISCRLVVINRSITRTGTDTQTRKVMVRVGGGWQDLDIYLLNRQAGSAF